MRIDSSGSSAQLIIKSVRISDMYFISSNLGIGYRLLGIGQRAVDNGCN